MAGCATDTADHLTSMSHRYSLQIPLHGMSSVKSKQVIISVKTISRDPLNISADELMERFVRGDSARSTEGSGLGLSIARSLVELQGGRFGIAIDCDLFKVELRFSAIEE